LYAAASYFLKAAELNVAESPALGRLWLGLAIAASLAIVALARSAWPLLLLWLPLPFYALSVAYGSVPIFVPTWWPFAQYNLRYGLQLLPVLAATLGVLVYLALRPRGRVILRRAAVLGVVLTISAGYVSLWQAGPICYRE